MTGMYLEHYGVLGMKWGVRRYQPYPKGEHGTFLGQSRDEDIRISKGSGAYRVQSTPNLEESGQVYVSLSKLDHLEYLSAASYPGGGVAVDAWDKMRASNKNEPDLYSVRMKLDSDIIAPSYQKTMDTFIRLVDETGPKRFAKDIYQGDPNSKKFEREFLKNYKNLTISEMRDKAYLSFTSKFMRNNEAKEKFFKSLEDQGYNAIVDDWDKRFEDKEKQYTESPIIVFKKDATLKQTGSQKLDSKDLDLFYMLYADTAKVSDISPSHEQYSQAKKWKEWALKHSIFSGKEVRRMADTYLEHYGVKGMKWGVRRTPEQLGHKTSSKRKKPSIFSSLAKSSKKKSAKAKQAKEAKKEESREETRAKLLKSTDPKFISKHMDLLDTRELQERIDRITKETTMKKLASGKDNANLKKGENVLKTIANMAESASKTVEAVNKISDAANKASKQSAEDRAKKEKERATAKEEKAKKNAIDKALSDLNKAGNVENISPDDLLKSISTANKAYDTIKNFSDIEISFDPRTGEPKFKKKT